MSYEFVSRGDDCMANLYDRVNNINVVSEDFEQALREAASNTISKRYKIMFDTVITDTKSKIQELDPSDPHYKDELINIKRAAKINAEFIAGRLPQGQDYDMCVNATMAAVSKLIEQAKGAK